LQGSQSLPTLLPGAAASGSAAASSSARPGNSKVPPADENVPGVSMQSLLKFLFPARLENPDSCGRLEIFGLYGPCDEEGNLRGGTAGAHIHGDTEIALMIKHNCREALYKVFLPKDRRDVETTVNTLMPAAMAQRYTAEEVKQLLSRVPCYPGTSRLKFTELQTTIKKSQEMRLGEMAKRAMSGKPIQPPKERPLKVSFQSRPCYELMAVTRKKKYTNLMEEEIARTKKLHAYSTLVASIEDQALAEQVKMNSNMCRDLGRLDDKWDRYCAIRRTGRSSYVQTRNTARFNPSMDCGLGNKHPRVGSLLAASCGGSSAGALLGAS